MRTGNKMVERRLDEIARAFYLNGQHDENFVMEATQRTLGGKCEKATRQEDMYKHIDFWWNSPKKGRIGIDVKGIKRGTRSGELDDTINWLELKNVRGKPGWLYGEARYIAFRTKTKVIFVKREKLLRFALEKTEGKETVHTCPKDFYIPYQRYGRDDLVIKVPTTDLEDMADFGITTI